LHAFYPAALYSINSPGVFLHMFCCRKSAAGLRKPNH